MVPKPVLFIHTAPPQPAQKFQNVTITLNQPAMIDCVVSALPRPDFQWVYDPTQQPLPQSSWASTYDDVMGISTLTHVFEAVDLGEDCTVSVVCIATNPSGRSEHHFTLSPDHPESCPGRDPHHPEVAVPPPIVSVSQEEQAQGREDVDSNEKKSSYWIIVSVIAVAVICILAGVFVLVLCFIKHFCQDCNKKK